jgi:hypothetical protein
VNSGSGTLRIGAESDKNECELTKANWATNDDSRYVGSLHTDVRISSADAAYGNKSRAFLKITERLLAIDCC